MVLHVVSQQIVLVERRVADLTLERLLRVRRVDPLVVLLQPVALGERLVAHFAPERVRIDVPLAVLVQAALLAKLSPTADGVPALVVFRLVVPLEGVEAVRNKVTAFAEQRAKLPNQVVLLGQLFGGFGRLPGG